MYSIKTDLGVLGNATVEKDLLVKGNAVFKQNVSIQGEVTFATANFTQINVSDLSTLKDLTVTGASNVKDLNVSGDTVLGTSDANTITVNGSTTFAAPADFAGNITQTAGVASLNEVLASSVAVSGDVDVDGNIVQKTTSTATLGNTTVQDLTVNGNTVITGTTSVTGKTTLQDVEINGVLSGSYTMETGNFENIKVSNQSDLQNVSIKGTTTLSGNVVGSTSTVTVNQFRGTGADSSLQFTYNDPARPSDIKTSLEPYQVSSEKIQAGNVVTEEASVGAVGTGGLKALGASTFDYLDIKGNSTIGTSRPQLTVAGDSVLAKTTVGDLVITGAVSGLTFEDLSVKTLTVTGASSLASVTMTGNLTGSDTGIASFSTFTVRDGISGNHGIIQFAYNDPARPSDIKTSIEPYQVSTTNVRSKSVQSESASIGVVGTGGLVSLGKADFDYLEINGNSTIGTATPQLKVAGKSVLHDVDFTGVVTGLTVDVSGQDLTPASVVATGEVKGNTLESVTTTTVGTNLTVGGNAEITGTIDVTGASSLAGDVTVTGQTTTVKDLVVTGTVTGVTAEANVDGLDIAPNSVAATTTVTAASVAATGAVSAASVTATGAVKGGTLEVTGTSTLAGVTAGATTVSTLDVTGASTLAGVTASTLTVPSITGNTTFANDVTITGVLTPASIDLSTTAVDAASVTTTGNVNVGGNLAVTGTVDLSTADVTAKTFKATETSLPSTLPVLNSTTATITTINATDIDASGDVSAASVAATGDVSAATVTSPSVQAAASGAGTLTLASDVVAAKDLTVTGTFKPEGGFDLSQVDVAAKSISTTEGATIGGNLSVAGTVDLSGADVTALSFVSSDALKTNTFPKLASTESTIGALTVTGESTLAGVAATNIGASGTLEVTGASTLAGVTAGEVQASSVVSTSSVSATSFTTAGATVQIAKSTNVAGDLHATGTLTAGAIDLSATDVTVKSLESLGNAHVVGDLTVDGQFDLSSTNLAALSLASSGNTTVGADLVLTTGVITGAPAISGNTTVGGTLGVTGATTLAGLTAGTSGLGNTTVTGTLNVSGVSTLAHTAANSLAVSGTTTLGSLAVPTGDASLGGKLTVTGDTTVEKLTVQGQLVPTGGIDLSDADISANSLALAAGATVGTTLGVTGNTTVGGTLTSTGAGKFGSVTSDNGATITTGNVVVSAGNVAVTGSITASETGSFKSVTAAEGLNVTNGNIVQGGTTSTATLKKTSVDNLHVGNNPAGWDDVKYIAQFGSGDVHIVGDVIVDGTINSAIDLTGREIQPRAVTAAAEVSVGTTLTVGGQATMASAILGAPGSVNNNLQINGNAVATGDFTVQGRIIGTLDQSTSDLLAQSVTSTTFVKGATLEVTSTSEFKGKITGTAGAVITGGVEVDTLETTGLASLDAVSVAKNATVTGNVAVTGTLAVTGISTVGVLNASSLSSSGTLAVTGTSSFTGKVTAATLEVTDKITTKDLEITGTLTADIADLVTDSIVTKAYFVTPNNSTVSTSTWTPSGTSNVENITVSSNINIQPIADVKGAGSWYFYITQDATGNREVNFDQSYTIIGGEVNKAPNSVSICQVMYCGVGSVYDVFIAQR